MAIVTVQKPDNISMSGNLKELILQSADAVEVKLSIGATVLLQETYYPGNGNLIHVDFADVVTTQLSFVLPSSDVFMQTGISKDFKIEYIGTAYTFRCIRSGKMNLTQSATAFLTENFLTWQPNTKPVTFYSPEWLTYFAPVSCQVRLKAYWEDKTNTVITLASPSAGSCYTFNVQYAVVSGKFSGKRPMYYDVWVESGDTRLSYVQRYVASEQQGEDEQWYIFENSLGGLDSLRAYGALKDEPEYTHNIANFGDQSEEFRIDVRRMQTRNTGNLTPEEARWLQDMFPSPQKYLYSISGLYPIVFTGGDASADTSKMPDSYTFTYRLADTRPYLDIQRRTDLPANLVIPIPTGETFFLPPRLAEFPKPTLSADLLLPVQEPHTEVWGGTTIGAVHDSVLNSLVKELDGLDLSPTGSGGGSDIYIIKTNDLTLPTDYNVFSALRTLDEIDNLLIEINDMFLRKDIPDTAHEAITFDKKIGSTIFLDGMDGKGWEIKDNGFGLFDSLRVRSDIFIGGKFGSPSFASGFTGWGVEIDIPTAAGTFDFLTVRKSMKVYELVYSQIYGLGGSVIISDLNKILYVETCQGFYRCYMDSMDATMRMNLRKDDIVRMQRSQGINIRYFYGEVLAVTPDYFDLKIIDGEDYPQLGDVVFRFGNKTDKNRQGIIYLTSSDDNAPYIDVLDGITDMSMFEKIKVRLGNFGGIRTKKGVQLKGYGIYAQGAVFEDSDIYLKDGTTVEQQFIVMNGKFESTIEGIRNDMSVESGNILKNSSFGQNMNYWKATNDISFINVGGSFLWMDGSFYSDKRSVADIYRDGSKNVLRVLGTTIAQSNDLFKGEKTEGSYSFSFYYKVLRPGTLSAGFSGQELFTTESLSVSDSYQKISKVAKWDGTGDFSIGFTGEILIYGVSLFNDALADAQIKLQTQIDQTAEYIKLLATKDYVNAETGEIYVHYDSQLKITAEQMSGISTKVEGLITESSGWVTRAEGTTIFAKKDMENGKSIVNAINVGTEGILISANRINLYGAVSFSMLSDYSNVNSKINNKADSSSLGDMAYRDYVSSADLAWDITNAITSKVSSSQLRNYAFNTGSAITKSDFASALQTEINAKMTGSSTTSGNKLASVIINGQTLIAGGYIQANLINADEIWCTKLKAVEGNIGGFEISGLDLVGYNCTLRIGLSKETISIGTGGVSCFYAEANRDCIRVNANGSSSAAAIRCSGSNGAYSITSSGGNIKYTFRSGERLRLEGIPDNKLGQGGAASRSGNLCFHYVDGRALLMIEQ